MWPRIRLLRVGPMVVLYVLLVVLLVVSVLTWVLDRRSAWANNWAPNFIAEWSGILIAVAVVGRLVQAEQRRRQRALRHTAGVALGRALRPMVDFMLTVAEVTGIETKPGEDLATFFERMLEEQPRAGIPDPRKCLVSWVTTLDKVDDRVRRVHDSYFMVLDPDEITQIDRLADSLAPRDWVIASAGREPESETVMHLMKPFVSQATRVLHHLGLYFEGMVGAPLTTGPWHVEPEQHVWWRTMTDDWQRVREDERRKVEWTWAVYPEATIDAPHS